MKKLFTLALALLVASVGFSQVQKQKMSKYDIRKSMTAIQQAPRMEGTIEYGENTPTMTSTRDIVAGELDQTFYDWQTNHAAINRTIVWPDGKVNFAFTCSTNSSHTDRGTAIGTYDSNNDEWIPSEGRVENEKTGFGSIARYGENGIVIAAHTVEQIVNPADVSAPDNLLRHVVTSVPDPLGHTLDGQIHGVEPKEEQTDIVALSLGTAHQFHQRAGRQGRLNGESLIPFEQLSHTHQRQPARLHRHALRIERGETVSDFIGIYKLTTVENFGQDGIGSRRFAGSVTTSDDIQILAHF